MLSKFIKAIKKPPVMILVLLLVTSSMVFGMTLLPLPSASMPIPKLEVLDTGSSRFIHTPQEPMNWPKIIAQLHADANTVEYQIKKEYLTLIEYPTPDEYLLEGKLQPMEEVFLLAEYQALKESQTQEELNEVIMRWEDCYMRKEYQTLKESLMSDEYLMLWEYIKQKASLTPPEYLTLTEYLKLKKYPMAKKSITPEESQYLTLMEYPAPDEYLTMNKFLTPKEYLMLWEYQTLKKSESLTLEEYLTMKGYLTLPQKSPTPELLPPKSVGDGSWTLLPDKQDGVKIANIDPDELKALQKKLLEQFTKTTDNGNSSEIINAPQETPTSYITSSPQSLEEQYDTKTDSDDKSVDLNSWTSLLDKDLK
jgi:hypothetical protein